MAVVTKHSLQFLKELVQKKHDIENDSLVIVLMNSSFTFDPINHSTYADLSGELPTQYGYTQKTKALTNVTASIVGANLEVKIDADNVQWNAVSGEIGPTGSAVIINTTYNDTVVQCIDYGTDYTTQAGDPFGINFSNGMTKLKSVVS